MEMGFRGAARRYIVYREERRKARAIRGDRTVDGQPQEQMFITLPDGGQEVLDPGPVSYTHLTLPTICSV